MTTARISVIGKVIRGVSWDKNDATDTKRPDYLPILRAGNIGNELNTESDLVWVPASNVGSEQRIQAGDIAICMSSGSPAVVGKTASAKVGWPGSVGAFCALIRANPERCLPAYLAFFLKSARFRKWTSESQGANIKNIKKSALEDFEVPVPPIPEQRRIVDLLSRAEGIVRLRREAEKKAAELIPALFLDMFGDPATNPKGWQVESLGKHVGIHSAVRTPDVAAEANVLCMGADSIESMTGRLISAPTVSDVLPKSGKYWFDAGDILYSKIRPYLAKAALAQCGGYCSADMYPLRCGPALRPKFLLSLLLSADFTEYATAESVRASMPKLNREALFRYHFPLPPMGLQNRFEESAEAVLAIQMQQSAATAKAQATFDALLAQTFNR